MDKEAKIAPVIKTLARKITHEELNQVSGGWFDKTTYVSVPADAQQENSYNGNGKYVGLDTLN